LEYDNRVINDVVQKLTELGYVNDEEFSKQWAEDRKAFNKTGKRKVITELINMGIDHKTAEDTVEQCQMDDLKVAESILEKKLKFSSIDLNDIKACNKIYKYLLSKGIGYDTARKAIARFTDINCSND
jgi:regulatory protein